MSKTKWRSSLMIWFIVGGLLLINASVFLSSDDPQALKVLWHYLKPQHWPAWYAVNLWLVFGGLFTALLLKNKQNQAVLHSFYASYFWQFVINRLKKSKPNQAIVQLCLRRKIGKRLLRKWFLFWKSIRIEHYPIYAWVFALLAVLFVIFTYSAIMTTARLHAWFYVVYFCDFIYDDIYKALYVGPLVEFNMNGAITWRLLIAPLTGLFVIVWLLRLASRSKKKKRRTV